MIKIIVADKHLLKSHMNGFDVCTLKNDTKDKKYEPVITQRNGNNGPTDDFSNFDSGTYHGTLKQALLKIKRHMVTDGDVETFDQLYRKLEYIDDIIRDIADKVGLDA